MDGAGGRPPIMTTAEGSAAPARVYEALSGVNGKINGI